MLGKPALNFAFADGVERYHTAHDDVAHLDPGSLQHHGAQMLRCTRVRRWSASAANDGRRGVLRPADRRPRSCIRRVGRGRSRSRHSRSFWRRWLASLDGAVGGCAILRIGRGRSGGFRRRRRRRRDVRRQRDCARSRIRWDGAARRHFEACTRRRSRCWQSRWRWPCWAIARRWALRPARTLARWSCGPAHRRLTWKLPGVSFMFVWPLIAGAIAAGMSVGAVAAAPDSLTPTIRSALWTWIATIVTLAVIVPILYAVSAVLLGAVGPGGIAAGILTPRRSKVILKPYRIKS